MKILKYIKYRMQGYNKYEAYNIMVQNYECTFEEYNKMFDKMFNKKVKAGEKDVSNKRNSRNKRKTNRT